eukprot:gnl/TRDRNA2_/TRDRNA2_87793_c0_seq1.p2 gnl/TRDRNA2_/TRDRNA2_87793_c0~~gnl/TRDRNA2_/TRDRNA2_87793_c0_seq1.p2  ORF type:complete len:107 (-),score=6.41 gnl/TRDRNA2_/TRDRNA2_87793_c0_seq1:85-405(-)
MHCRVIRTHCPKLASLAQPLDDLARTLSLKLQQRAPADPAALPHPQGRHVPCPKSEESMRPPGAEPHTPSPQSQVHGRAILAVVEHRPVLHVHFPNSSVRVLSLGV